jgi:putative hydroxymethylpyrimidine transport system substrate-binding protein
MAVFRFSRQAFLGASLTLALALTASAQVQAQARAEKLTVMLDWFVNPDHGPLIVALEKGFFAEAGLEVELVEPADPNDPPKLVAAGKAALAVSYQPQLHIHAAEGLPLARIGTLVATPLNTLLVLDDRWAASRTRCSRPCWRPPASRSTTSP